MRTTIAGAGRVVIPKAMRDDAGLAAGAEIEIELRDGRIEIEPAATAMQLTRHGQTSVVEAAAEMPPLTADDVRDVLERTRR